MAAAAKEIHIDLTPIIKVYTDGTVERLLGSPHVPPSPSDPATGVATEDISATATTPGARLHLPSPAHTHGKKLPILLYFHGGGFCVESAFSALDHRYTNALSAAASALVVSVDYHLAPEHPLPAAYEDAWAALAWVSSHSLPDTPKHPWIARHGDLTKIFVGGDSAGANIAHNIAIRAGSDPLPGPVSITGAIISHPYFWGSNPMGDEPREEIEKHLCYRLWELVYPGAGIDNPMINPVGDEGTRLLSGMGCRKLMVCVAEKDVLSGRGMAYAERVKGSDWKGEVVVERVEGEEHCFQVADPDRDKSKDLIGRIAGFILSG